MVHALDAAAAVKMIEACESCAACKSHEAAWSTIWRSLSERRLTRHLRREVGVFIHQNVHGAFDRAPGVHARGSAETVDENYDICGSLRSDGLVTSVTAMANSERMGDEHADQCSIY